MDRQREAQEMPDMDAPAVYKQALEIWETEEYVLAKGWCDYIYQKRKMGVLIGAPGTGKTTILKKFALDHPGSIYIEAMPNMRVNDLAFTKSCAKRHMDFGLPLLDCSVLSISPARPRAS